MTDSLLTVVQLLADTPPKNTGPEFGKASPLGFFILIALLVATFFLVWSMNRQLKKLPESFDEEHPEADQAVDDGTVGPVGDGVESGSAKDRESSG